METLPIGSVILPKNSKIGLMIIGYLPNKFKDKTIKKYICCKCKTGIVKPSKELVLNDEIFYIDENDIDKIFFMGYQGEELNKYSEIIDYFYIELKEIQKKKSVEPEDIITLLINLFEEKRTADEK